MDIIGYGSLNIDEFWEVPDKFLSDYKLEVGSEYIKDLTWFKAAHQDLLNRGKHLGNDPGGSAANTIAALKKLGFATGFFGASGLADQKDLRISDLGNPGCLRIRTHEMPSGRCLSFITGKGLTKDRVLVISPNANDNAVTISSDLDYFSKAKWIHFTSFIAKEPLKSQIGVVEQLAGKVKISFDPGILYCKLPTDQILPILTRTDIVFLTIEELRLITSIEQEAHAVWDLRKILKGIIVVKKGVEGISVYNQDEVYHAPAIIPAKVVDRTGAGDVAAAGFLAGFIMSLDLETCTKLAVQAAGCSVQGYGRTSYPDRSQLEHLIS